MLCTSYDTKNLKIYFLFVSNLVHFNLLENQENKMNDVILSVSTKNGFISKLTFADTLIHEFLMRISRYFFFKKTKENYD